MFAVPTAFHRLSVCRLKKQPTRDDAPSKGDQPAKDDQATQGGDANSTTGDSNPKLDPTSSGTRVTSKAPLGSKGFHTLTTFKFPHSRQNSSIQTSSLFAQAKGNKESSLADSQSSSLHSSSLFAQPKGKAKLTLADSQSSNLHTSNFFAQATGEFALADRQDSSRDTAAAAEAKNADRGVASGSTRKDANDTGRPNESAPTASEVLITTNITTMI